MMAGSRIGSIVCPLYLRVASGRIPLGWGAMVREFELSFTQPARSMIAAIGASIHARAGGR